MKLSPSSDWLYSVLYGAIQCSRVNCRAPDLLVKWLLHRLPDNTGLSGLDDRVARVANGLKQTPLNSLVRDDLLMIVQVLERISWPANRDQMADRLSQMQHAARKSFVKCGLEVPDVSVYVVDDFPGPYRGGPFWAMSLDNKDAADYGIKPGIYFKTEHLYPVVSELTYCHELVHAMFSLRPSQELVRGLEDGLCDLLGLHACLRVFPYELASTALVNLRFFPSAPLDAIYLDHLRQAAAMCQRLGFGRLLKLARRVQQEGRRFLYQVEDDMILGTDRLIPRLAKGRVQQTRRSAEIEQFCFAVLHQPVGYVLSPEAVYLGRHLKPGDSTVGVCQRFGMSKHAFRKALKELSDDFYLVLIDEGVVLSNECSRYIADAAFRYKFN